MQTYKQAADKHRFGITVNSIRDPKTTNTRAQPWTDTAFKLSVTLYQLNDDNHEINKYTFAYHMGTGHAEYRKTSFGTQLVKRPKPTVEEILQCLATDYQGWNDSRGFEDWAEQYGYDLDSREAEKLYSTVAQQCREVEKTYGCKLMHDLAYETGEDGE